MNKMTEKSKATKSVIRIGDLTAALGCSRQTITNMIARGDIPQPMRLGKSRPFWPAFEIEAALKRCPVVDQNKAA
jgi:predicted DNA-binding transcriptional regulator AlpA